MPDSEIDTPCKRICAVDAASGLCVGCGRSLAEIAQWGRLSPEQRRTVMAGLPARFKQYGWSGPDA